jgi:hypothetical protein
VLVVFDAMLTIWEETGEAFPKHFQKLLVDLPSKHDFQLLAELLVTPYAAVEAYLARLQK